MKSRSLLALPLRVWARPTAAMAVAIAYVTAMFMSAVDMQIVNVALPTLSRDFAAPLSDVQWTTIAYLLSLAVLIPASGWIGDRVGLKPSFLFALGLFTVASAICGVVHSLDELIAARALQGAGGGMMSPTITSMLYHTYPPKQRARLARTVILPILIGPASAPILGGILTQWASWRWIFLLNVPVGVLMLGFAWKYLPRTAPTTSGRLDLTGMVLAGTGLSFLLYAVSEGSALGWDSTRILVSGVAGIVLLGVFVRHSLTHRDPILRLGLLRNRLFRATNIVFALSTGPFLASLYLTPIFLQEVLHQSPVSSGATTFLEAIGVGVGSQTISRLYPRLGPRTLTALGSAGLTVYLTSFLFFGPGTNLWAIRATMLAGGLFNASTFLATQTAMFTTIGKSDLSHASAIYNTQRQSTIALNIAVVTTIVAGSATATVGAFHAAYLAAALIALVGTAGALSLIHTSDAHATMGISPGLDA